MRLTIDTKAQHPLLQVLVLQCVCACPVCVYLCVCGCVSKCMPSEHACKNQARNN